MRLGDFYYMGTPTRPGSLRDAIRCYTRIGNKNNAACERLATIWGLGHGLPPDDSELIQDEKDCKVPRDYQLCLFWENQASTVPYEFWSNVHCASKIESISCLRCDCITPTFIQCCSPSSSSVASHGKSKWSTATVEMENSFTKFFLGSLSTTPSSLEPWSLRWQHCVTLLSSPSSSSTWSRSVVVFANGDMMTKDQYESLLLHPNRPLFVSFILRFCF
jgi:hypothetical protein